MIVAKLIYIMNVINFHNIILRFCLLTVCNNTIRAIQHNLNQPHMEEKIKRSMNSNFFKMWSTVSFFFFFFENDAVSWNICLIISPSCNDIFKFYKQNLSVLQPISIKLSIRQMQYIQILTLCYLSNSISQKPYPLK